MGAPISCILNSLCLVGGLKKSMLSSMVGHTQNQFVNDFISYDIFPIIKSQILWLSMLIKGMVSIFSDLEGKWIDVDI